MAIPRVTFDLGPTTNTGSPETTTERKTTSSKGYSMSFESLLETERSAKFEEIYDSIKELIEREPTKKELEKEAKLLMARKAEASSKLSLAMMLGASKNPIGNIIATQAVQEDQLLQYAFDTLIASPKEYMMEKRKERLKDLEAFMQGAGAFIASGGKGKAEAGTVLANMAMANSQVEAARIQAGAQQQGGGGGMAMPFTSLLAQFISMGVSEGALKPLIEASKVEQNTMINNSNNQSGGIN